MHIERRGTFELPFPRERAFELFTPEGERAWVAGWDPEPLHAPGGRLDVEGAVFRTRAHDEETLWIVLGVDRGAFVAEYARITPGRREARRSRAGRRARGSGAGRRGRAWPAAKSFTARRNSGIRAASSCRPAACLWPPKRCSSGAHDSSAARMSKPGMLRHDPCATPCSTDSTMAGR